jgi:hypothetical protein
MSTDGASVEKDTWRRRNGGGGVKEEEGPARTRTLLRNMASMSARQLPEPSESFFKTGVVFNTVLVF